MANGQADTSRRDAFEAIYRRGGWLCSTKTVSGRGSEVVTTKILLADLYRWLEQHPEFARVFDAPCGDFNCIQHISFGSDAHFIEGNIVADLIQNLRWRYESKKTSFVHLDIVADDVSEGDAWFCQDVLIHLRFNDGERDVR
jgi:hypothetical protein